MGQTKKEKEAAARKRSESAKKAAETRRQRTAEEQVKAEASSNEATEQPRVEVSTFRADVNPGDQHAAEARRQAELAEARRVHNERTGDASLA